MKKKWSEIKEHISDIIKFIICTFTGVMGFWLIYMIIWFAVGLPQSNWAIWLLLALAFGSERLFIEWLQN